MIELGRVQELMVVRENKKVSGWKHPMPGGIGRNATSIL